MAEKAARTKWITVAASKLKIHPRAQRAVIPSHLKYLTDNLDMDAIGSVDVVDYPIHGQEGPWVINGQHRVLALQARDPSDCPVKALLHLDVTDDARSAELFLRLNYNKGVSPFQKFGIRVIAQDATALGVKRILKQFGLAVRDQKRDGGMCCVSSLQNLYARDGGESLGKALRLITRSWGSRADAMEGKLLDGVGIVVSSYDGKLDEDALVRKLAKYPGGAASLLGEARIITRVNRMPVARSVAEAVVNLYNHGRSTGKLPALEGR